MGTTVYHSRTALSLKRFIMKDVPLRYIANYLGFSKTTIFNEPPTKWWRYQAELSAI